jgi:2-amino-4-hydroxy-6-hydroxymethyldihydropteridine diphosphokinase
MASVYISLGSNIKRVKHIQLGINSLKQAFGELTLSSLFESEAVGFSGKAFYNMVIALETQKSVVEVAHILRDIEFSHGRSANAKKFSPRSLDLDLLLYDDLIMEDPAQIPRDEITKNAFVLWPLSQVAPNVLHPILKTSFQKLWTDYNKSSQKLNIVANCW